MSRTRIALFRGINVGKAKRIAMADLRNLMSELGYENPRTLLNSGNLVVDLGRTMPEDDLARSIEAAVADRLGVSSRVTVIDRLELESILAADPLRAAVTDDSRYLVGILNRAEDASRLASLLTEDWSPEGLAVSGRAVYTWCPEGVLASKANAAIAKRLKDAITSRNWSTLTRLNAL